MQSFVQAMTAKFKTPDNGPKFIAEYKELTDDDKRDLWHGFKSIGVDCDVPKGSNGAAIDVSTNPRNY